ncbi:hypothetical protein MY3296_008445 [Beauveria thailandica]
MAKKRPPTSVNPAFGSFLMESATTRRGTPTHDMDDAIVKHTRLATMYIDSRPTDVGLATCTSVVITGIELSCKLTFVIWM